MINLVAGALGGGIGSSDPPDAKSSDKVAGYSGVALGTAMPEAPALPCRACREHPDATRRKAKAREERRRLIHIKRRSRGQT